MSEQVPVSLLAPLADLWKWLDAIPAQAVLVGGVAVSLLGRPRFTHDIDALVSLAENEWEAALAAAPTHGIVARIDNPLEFARRTHVLLLRHSASAIDIDVILGGLPFEHSAVEHGGAHTIGGVSIRLPRIEDLLIMKAVAHRPQDLQDIEALLDAHPDTDVTKARQWVREFAAATSMSELIDDFESVLARRKVPGQQG